MKPKKEKKSKTGVIPITLVITTMFIVSCSAVSATPPDICCEESVNPHGQTIPPAGWSTMPGPKGGKNDDGFYELTASSGCGLPVEIYVSYPGADPYLFGPFTSGIVVKFTEAPGAEPKMKKIGSTNGQAGAVTWHFILPDDPVLTAVDSAGTVNTCSLCCPVPPPPK